MTKRKSQINCAQSGLRNWVKFVPHPTGPIVRPHSSDNLSLSVTEKVMEDP